MINNSLFLWLTERKNGFNNSQVHLLADINCSRQMVIFHQLLKLFNYQENISSVIIKRAASWRWISQSLQKLCLCLFMGQKASINGYLGLIKLRLWLFNAYFPAFQAQKGTMNALARHATVLTVMSKCCCGFEIIQNVWLTFGPDDQKLNPSEAKNRHVHKVKGTTSSFKQIRGQMH